jgi:GNAT superfamily N-acetyltransferase
VAWLAQDFEAPWQDRMESTTIDIRFGGVADCALVARYLRDLAAHDGEAETCKMTEADVRRWGFGPDRRFETLIAERAGRPVGMALFYPIFSTWDALPGLFLNDLYVADEGRGHGIGRRLMAELSRLALARGCGRLEWHVLQHAGAITFYEAMGARRIEEFLTYRLAGEALVRLAEKAGPRPIAGEAGR